MTIIEAGALASGLLAVIMLITRIIKLITTIQSLIQRLDQLQDEMIETKELWHESSAKYEKLDQRLTHIEYNLSIV